MGVMGVEGPMAFLLDTANRRRVQIDGKNYSPDQQRELVMLARHSEELPHLSVEEAERRFPGMLPWSWRNQRLAVMVGFGGVLVAVALAVGVAVLVDRLS